MITVFLDLSTPSKIGSLVNLAVDMSGGSGVLGKGGIISGSVLEPLDY